MNEVVVAGPGLHRHDREEMVWIAGANERVKVIAFEIDQDWLMNAVARQLETAISAERDRLREFVRAFAPQLESSFNEVLDRAQDAKARMTP